MIEGDEIVVDTGAVAARELTGARLGASIFASGGNAADAAAAVGIAQCLILPSQAGLAGYLGCAVVLEAGATGGRVWSVDANSTAPAAAREDMYDVTPKAEGEVPADHDTVNRCGGGINENEYDCHVRDDANIHGPLAASVPGTMACIGIIHERWGRLPWPRIVQPSLDMLGSGLRVPGPGDVEHRPRLLPTLSRIASVGWLKPA